MTALKTAPYTTCTYHNISELVNGSHLYKPEISVDDVILPEQTKKRVISTVLNFEKVKDVIHESGMGEKISYGLGQVLLFYGASGTGKVSILVHLLV